MSDVTPPKPPGPKDALRGAKGLAGKLKGQPKWVWIAGITVLLGVAYITWKRSQATPATEEATDPSEGYGPVAGYETQDDGGLFPAPSQGAYGGYDDPGYMDNYDPSPVAPQTVININPGPSLAPAQTVPTGVSPAVGGVQQQRSAVSHFGPPTPTYVKGASMTPQQVTKAKKKGLVSVGTVVKKSVGLGGLDPVVKKPAKKHKKKKHHR